MLDKKLATKLKLIPRSAGVYLMKNQFDRIIYVGKAKQLHKRVRSYFNRKIDDPKTRQLVKNIVDIDWFLTDSELEALMLETNLIKKYRPRYNILMKDDKNYVYIKITKEKFPRVFLVRQIGRDGAKYFGPYTNSFTVKKVLRSLNRIFPFFTYESSSGISPMNSQAGKELFYKRAKSVWGDLSDPSVYQAMIADLIHFLKGQTSSVIKLFRHEMGQAAAERNFEGAAILRDRVRDIEAMTESQRVVSSKREDVDVIGVYGEDKEWVVSLAVVREGKLIDLKNVMMAGERLPDGRELIDYFMVDYYQRTMDWPRRIYLPTQLADEKLLRDWLTTRKGGTIDIVYPQKGDKKKLINLVEKNARMEWLRRRSLKTYARKDGVSWWELSEVLLGKNIKLIELNRPVPLAYRIEAYDISNLGETGVVGGMVVWELKTVQANQPKDQPEAGQLSEEDKVKLIKKGKGSFNKKLYKRFEIKSFRGQDDFAAMNEMLGRRFKHQDKDWVWPDLVLIDGGKGQLGTVLKILHQMSVDVPVIGLAKKEEEVWVGKLRTRSEKVQTNEDIEYSKLILDKSSLASLLLQGIRDEVHRFAVSYQRVVRQKAVRRSVLDEVDGLGPKKKKILLQKFGSLGGVREAGEKKVAEVVGNKLAKKIFEMV